MRFVLVLCVFASGCSVLDNIDFQAPPEPGRVYLSRTESVRLHRSDDLDRFVCITALLQCELMGTEWRCYCP